MSTLTKLLCCQARGSSRLMCSSTSASSDDKYQSSRSTISDGLGQLTVMVEEVIGYLQPQKDKVFLDMSFGVGGYSKRLLKDGATVLALERDPTAYLKAQELQKQHPKQFFPMLGRFSELPHLLQLWGIPAHSLSGVKLDTGYSAMPFDDPTRSFMLFQDVPLDMRIEEQFRSGEEKINNDLTAAQVLQHVDEFNLKKIFKYYGQEKKARVIAKAIVESRYSLHPLNSTRELAELVASVVGDSVDSDDPNNYSHPATNVLMALRRFVNNELNELDYAFRVAHYYLKHKGPMVAISFSNVEDKIIKKKFTGVEINKSTTDVGGGGLQKNERMRKNVSDHGVTPSFVRYWESLNKKAVTPDKEEVSTNPRSRWAKLRAAVKISQQVS